MKEKPNYFVRFLISGFILFLLFLVTISFFKSDMKFNLNTGVITVLLLITVLILSEAFDNLSLGKLLSLNREIKNKTEEVSRIKQENSELRENLVRLSATFSQLQTQKMTNNNMLFTPDTLRMMLGVEKAPEKEKEDEVVEEKKDESYTLSSNNAIPNSGIPKQRIDYRIVEEIVFQKYSEKHNIPVLELVRDVRFTSSFEYIDPIMERKINFDGYYKTYENENFIEVKRANIPSIMFDRIYVLLAKI